MEPLDTSSLLSDYIDDANRHLDALDNAFLEIGRDQGAEGLDRELVTGLLGSLHTLKGNSGRMCFISAQKFVHQLEGACKRLLETSVLLDRVLAKDAQMSAAG